MLKCDLSAGLGEWVDGTDWAEVARGVAPGGPQDRSSAALVNHLVGNPLSAPVFEMLLWPPIITFLEHGCVALGGADVQASLNGGLIRSWESFSVEEGDVLEMQLRGAGSRLYMGASQSVLPLSFCGRSAWRELRSILPSLTPLRVLAGRDFDVDSKGKFLHGSRWRVLQQMSGMGCRLVPLDGLSALSLIDGDSLVGSSAPVQDGLLQWTPEGLIALLRGRGTMGGYPQLGSVLDADVDRLAQLRPGNTVELALATDEEAMQVQSRYEGWFSQLV